MSETVLIKNGTIVTMGAEGTLENGCVLLENGKIVKVGQSIDPPENCRVIDVHGGSVMPGIIDAHCHIGIFESGIGDAGVDGNERCLVLGHSMQTNERHYSFSDRRKVDDVKAKLNNLKMASTA